jgi:bifunctional non-homologous end joining protein LigD
LLGIPERDGLRYVGKVGTGFSDTARQALLKDLGPLTLRHSPFRSPLPAGETAAAHFARPVLVGEVAYGEWTAAGRLRHPTWRGLRPDKAPDDVVVE